MYFLNIVFQLIKAEHVCTFKEHRGKEKETLELYCIGNDYTSIDSNRLKEFPNVRRLVIIDTLLSALPEDLKHLSVLKELIYVNNIYTKDINALANLPNKGELKILALERNKLKSIPECIGEFTNLQRLNLSHNKINKLPDTIGNLTWLIFLNINHNLISCIPESFINLRSLIKCELSDNCIRELPIKFGEMKSLSKLTLNNNDIKIFPSVVLDISSLKSLNLSHNKIERLPLDIYKIQYIQLQDLDLTFNRIIEYGDTLGLEWNDSKLQNLKALKLTNQIDLTTENREQVILHGKKKESRGIKRKDDTEYITAKDIKRKRISTESIVSGDEKKENFNSESSKITDDSVSESSKIADDSVSKLTNQIDLTTENREQGILHGKKEKPIRNKGKYYIEYIMANHIKKKHRHIEFRALLDDKKENFDSESSEMSDDSVSEFSSEMSDDSVSEFSSEMSDDSVSKLTNQKDLTTENIKQETLHGKPEESRGIKKEGETKDIPDKHKKRKRKSTVLDDGEKEDDSVSELNSKFKRQKL